ncbi:ATP-binding protein [Caminibacter pacificus]|uniref:ATP-binding protein n=1 Tax=Caminibacter pacificus TaxID=1424653 RepID=A0AAJ4RB61_9BACT|nr:ATP-binding protein [Caminibacter pacificus]QDD68152.1 ATP-binding protein [Caminibacter pacificus]ROR38770.1 DNA helicase HerA-like ATPase [Caminibacter pacificus]
MGIKSFLKDSAFLIKEITRDCILKKIGDSYLNFSDSFTIVDAGKNYVKTPQKKLYAVEIKGFGNIQRTLSILPQIVKEFAFKQGNIYIFLTKNKVNFEGSYDFVSKSSVYLFSENKALLERIAGFFEAKLLSSKAIIKALLDIFQVNVYKSDFESFGLKTENIIYDKTPAYIDPIGCGFKKIFLEGAYKQVKDYKLYQIVGNTTSLNNINLLDLFKLDWKGYIAITLIINRDIIQRKTKFLVGDVKKFEKNKEIKQEFINFEESLRNKEDNYSIIMANIVAVIDNPKIIADISGFFNSSIYIEKEIFKKSLIYKTPILSRDIDFDFYIAVEDAVPLISQVFKNKELKVKNPKVLRGRDISHNYVSFSFAESATPHFFILGKTRAGKSFFLQKMTSGIIRYDVKINRVNNKEFYMRYFDKGNSAIKFVSKLKESNVSKEVVSIQNLKEFRFSFLDISAKNGVPDFEEVDFSIMIMNMYLEGHDIAPFNAIEIGELKEAINNVFFNGYQGVNLYKLMEDEAYRKVINNLFEAHPELNNEFTKNTDIPLDSDFAFLNKPRIIDLINYLSIKKQSQTIDDMQRNSIENTLLKLKALNSNKLFNGYSSFTLDAAKKFFYFDIDDLKSLGEKEFVPAFWFIFQKLYKQDKQRGKEFKAKGKLPTPVYYYLEEAHSYLKYKSFVSNFSEFAREAAKYNIHLGFISQFAGDLPEDVFRSLGTKIVLPPENIKDALKDLKNMWAENPEYIKFYDEYAKRFYAFVEYERGLFTLNQKISEEEQWLFDSEK